MTPNGTIFGVMGTYDLVIRDAVKNVIRGKYPDGTLIVDEFSIRNSRADIAVFSDSMTGIELKSERDSLVRLPKQVRDYDSVFPVNILVVHTRHMEGAKKIVPDHWGLTEWTTNRRLHVYREPVAHDVDVFTASCLLWDSELRMSLKARDALRGYASKNKVVKRHRFVETFGADGISEIVRIIHRRPELTDGDGRPLWDRVSNKPRTGIERVSAQGLPDFCSKIQ